MADVEVAAPSQQVREFAIAREADSKWIKFKESRIRNEKQVSHELMSKKPLQRLHDSTDASSSSSMQRQLPIDLLAKEWLNLAKPSIDSRLYLLEHVLPSAILGVEKLCTEVSRRGLENSPSLTPGGFNPINYLAQYMMRNNPRYSNFAEASPYMRGLRQVSTELREQVSSMEENKLARLKAEARRRRDERERQEALEREREAERRRLLGEVFDNWLIHEEVAIEMAQVHLALRAFDPALDSPLDTSGQLLTKHQFEELLWTYQTEPSDKGEEHFTRLLEHFREFGGDRRLSALQVHYRMLLEKVFDKCDLDKTGFLDRLRVLHILKCFYDELEEDMKDHVMDPRKWPVAEIIEDELEEEKEEEERLTELASTLSLDSSDITEGVEEDGDEGKGKTPEESLKGTSNGSVQGSVEHKVSAEQTTQEERQGDGEKEAAPVTEPLTEGEPETATQQVGDGDGGGREEKGDGGDEEVVLPGGGSEEGGKGEEESGDSKLKTEGNKDGVDEKAEGMNGVEEEAEGVNGVGDGGEPGSEEEKGGDVEQKQEEHVSEGTSDRSEGGSGHSEVKPDSVSRRMSLLLEEPEESVSEVTLLMVGEDGQPPSHIRDLHSRAVSISKSRRLSGMSTSTPLIQTGPGQSWDHEYLTPAQFAQLMELFLGRDSSFSLYHRLSSFFEDNYKETSKERAERLKHFHEQAEAQRRHSCINQLFEAWDNDSSGYLELEELQMVIKTWKDFTDEQALLHAQAVISEMASDTSIARLTRVQFHHYIGELTSNLESPEMFDEFADYLMSSMKLSFEEKRRKEHRQQWVEYILLKGKTNCLDLSPALHSAVSILLKDSKMFTEHLRLSVCIGMLDPTDNSCLQFKAASEDCRDVVVGRKLHRYNKQVSFTAIDSGRPLYIPSLQKNSGVHFFMSKHLISSEMDGALLVVPIRTPLGDVVGTLNVDTLCEEDLTDGASSDPTIEPHEQNFHQGVSAALGEVVHLIEVRRQLLHTSHVAMEWLHRRCPHITDSAFYFVEPLPPEQPTSRPASSHALVPMDEREETPSLFTPLPLLARMQRTFILREALLKGIEGEIRANKNPPRLYFHENLFKRYLYDGAENSEAVTAEAFGKKHLAYPIRDHTGCAVAVVDLGMRKGCPVPAEEMREAMKVLKLLTMAHHQLSRGSVSSGLESAATDPGNSRPPRKVSHLRDATMLFHQLMLSDLRERVEKLDARVFAELRSYSDPPPVVHQVIQAVLAIFHPAEDLQQWASCKPLLTMSLVKMVVSFDPFTAKIPSPERTKAIMEALDSKSVLKCSLPARHLYNWLAVCLILMDHSAAVEANKPKV